MIEIITDPDEAIKSILNDNPDVKVFTDGSRMENCIGASAALYRRGRLKASLRHQLGSQCQHTVFKGEGVGALLGMKLINNKWGIQSAIIYINNQASIKATMLMKPSAGHYIFNTIHKSIASLWKKHTGIKIKIKWVPGHKGVEGNKKADEEAKKVIMDGSSPADKLPNLLRKKLPYSKAAMVQAYGEKLKGRAQKAWMTSQWYNKMKKTDPMTPSNKYLKLIMPLPRKLTSILSQLRMGHIPLAKHLHHISKADSLTCPACHQAEETTQHFLLHCPAHNTARLVLPQLKLRFLLPWEINYIKLPKYLRS